MQIYISIHVNWFFLANALSFALALSRSLPHFCSFYVFISLAFSPSLARLLTFALVLSRALSPCLSRLPPPVSFRHHVSPPLPATPSFPFFLLLAFSTQHCVYFLRLTHFLSQNFSLESLKHFLCHRTLRPRPLVRIEQVVTLRLGVEPDLELQSIKFALHRDICESLGHDSFAALHVM